MSLEGFADYQKEDAEKYSKLRWWLGITLGDILDKAADLYPNKEALVDDVSRLTYSQLQEKVNRLAISLMKLGIKPGDCVLLQLPNWSEFVYSYFAISKIGAVVVLLLPGHSEVEIIHFCKVTGATAWILPEKWRKVEYLPLIDKVRQANENLKHIILARGKESSGKFISLEKLLHDADLTEATTKELINRRPDPSEVAIILPSGGTTGLPKLAPRPHTSYICNVEYKSRAFEMNSFDIGLLFTPVGHNLALEAGIASLMFSFGKVVLLDSTRPEDFCSMVQQERVTYTTMVPALATRILNFDGLNNYDLSSLTKTNIGATVVPPELVIRIEEEIGCKCLNAFGMVEGPGCQIRLDDKQEIAYYTSGRPTCPYDTFKIISENGDELPPNTEGELIAKGPGIFTGYFKSPEENRKVFTREGSLRTGDLAVIDELGNMRITGRIKDIIIRGGENISASEIEAIIIVHSDVQDVAVVAMPDEELGERVCAYVQPVAGASPGSEDIISFMKSKGATGLLLPERIEFIVELPLTKAGKADKKVLREDIKKRLGLA